MPTTYDRLTGYYRVSCNTCGSSHLISDPGRYATVSIGDDAGRAANEIYEYVSESRNQPEGYRPRCRSCRRAARRRIAATQRTTGGLTTTARTAAALGLSRTFGVEIELIGPGTAAIQAALDAAGYGNWRVKYDGSLSSGGSEVVSPVLSGEEGIEAIRAVTRILRTTGCRINRTCGLHVHHGIRDLTVDAVKRAARAWSGNQGLIDGLVSESRRNGNNSYCRRLSTTDLATIEGATTLREIEYLRVDRYRTFNLGSYGRFGTVEIRQHQGTLDAEKIISWIRLGQGILDTAANGEVERATTIRGLFAALGNRLDETARTFLTGRAVEFGVATV